MIVGVSGGELRARGLVAAYDVRTGHRRWVFHTTNRAPPEGRQLAQGGASLWQTPAVDPRLGLTYLGTGHAAPDINGRKRAGENLYSAPIVALDVRHGHVQWSFQQVHHDIWDYDSAQPPMLFDVVRGGARVPALGERSKNGSDLILDRPRACPCST